VDALITIREHASRARERLPASMLPYWLAASRDDEAGGFLLHDDVLRRPARRIGRAVLKGWRVRPSDDKQLVTQARLVWVFARAHRAGYGDGVYLDAAGRGRQFLVDHFLDRERGGYRWKTDRFGAPVNDVKLFYGQAFVVYAFVELARASGTRAPLDDALDLFGAVERELHDDEHRGWREQAAGDWGALPDRDPRVEVEFAGHKSANGIVHWLEATSELGAETGDLDVRRSLAEALDVLRTHLFPADPNLTREPCLADWTPDPASEHRMSYGHNVEFAWLMLRAQDVLGVERDWERFHAYVDHTLRLGYDHDRGAAFTWGVGDQPASRRHKVWWVQCELIVALCVALEESYDERYAQALAQTLTFVERHMTDPRDGILLDSVEEDGRRRWPRKSGDWKAGYHDVRAAFRLRDGFAP
jgi:mannobiose 2-epimerase